MKFIMYKKRTKKEVVEKFKNEDKDLLEETIEKLKELGYINDRGDSNRTLQSNERIPHTQNCIQDILTPSTFCEK